ncbi:transmembrane and coiled-coil domain-containing protein 6 [Esox lucius]|uniref:IBB domain-containing protein n=1 Tax=Esox lucius TaxID=8010 RepID=A0A3P9A8Z7_ESOLU|nr:transmembrane and coiled-coil domain-containing protein 6 [Esox lucius]
MWRLNVVRHKAGRQGISLEELKFKKRAHEKELRQARRDSQLVSKRLLVNEDEDEEGGTMDTMASDQVLEYLQMITIDRDVVNKEAHLRALRKALRSPSAHLTFIKQQGSISVLVTNLSGPHPQCRLEAARCFHELSHSPHREVDPWRLRQATPYLITYLSGQSPKFTELCLYTLANMCPDSENVRELLLVQGVVPALTSCIQIHRYNLAVVEAVAFTFSQLVSANSASGEMIPAVLASGLIPHLLSALTPDPQFGLGPAIECAWCLHYLCCSNVDNGTLVAQGALLQCTSLLVTLGGAVAKGSVMEGLELLIWPLLRCVGNLLLSGPLGALQPHLKDSRLLAALIAFAQVFLRTHPALARESIWVLNNLTADSSVFSSAMLYLNLVPGLIQLLPFSEGINTMVLRVLGNIAHHGREYCVHLAQAGLLSALCATLKMADSEVVTFSLEVLGQLVASDTQLADEFIKQSGLPLLEAIQFNSQETIRIRATHLLEHHLTPLCLVDTSESP